MCEGGVFSKLSDDVILNILYKLEEDPRNWARVSCISTKFSSLIRTVCFRSKCSESIPAVVSDLLLPPGGWAWASLFKLAVCCPGLIHSGVPLDNSDFGIDDDQSYKEHGLLEFTVPEEGIPESSTVPASTWSLHDDLLFGESSIPAADSIAACKRRKICVVRPRRSHLASGIWNLSREQGNKLLASRFKGDCLYICDWPGCIHIEEKRNYMLFRGIFKNFKQSRVWRTISDDRSKIIELNCIYCSSKETWDLHSSFCLRRYFGYHDDGEPVVRAYVCENGHVSGAWTNWPLYT
ncbi:hypothetical protein ABFS82_14G131000 [Erythranthe guttata]|uniref:phytochrome A-associated F-box protein-like n=1 Tax=Erythranthe guttata TaxID=4155 RepID=UPI00064DC8C1|nr:PREDICTED: phytochrome A-associated F-box protein-like [Erythranthe guttata]|eukprot:XP_012831535.1 PREDICTED: phytochrome A-associated F-box protein-like [Erythranthe guttata]